MNATGLLLCLLAMQIQRASAQDASKNAAVSTTHKPNASEGDVGNLRHVLKSKLNLWPNGRIPYTISAAFTPYSRSIIAAAIADFHANTCVKFVPKEPSDVDHVDIFFFRGCASFLGRYGRADRDDYVKINWQNMDLLSRAQFWKYPITAVSHEGTPYDYGSIMHYNMYASSWNGLPTIELYKPGVSVGQRRGFSELDIAKINRLYKCDMSNATTTAAPSSKPLLRPCKDKLPNCAILKKVGHCGFQNSKQFVQSNCPVSCGFCMADGSAPCMDEGEVCEAWAASGSCSHPRFREIMAAIAADFALTTRLIFGDANTHGILKNSAPTNAKINSVTKYKFTRTRGGPGRATSSRSGEMDAEKLVAIDTRGVCLHETITADHLTSLMDAQINDNAYLMPDETEAEKDAFSGFFANCTAVRNNKTFPHDPVCEPYEHKNILSAKNDACDSQYEPTSLGKMTISLPDGIWSTRQHAHESMCHEDNTNLWTRIGMVNGTYEQRYHNLCRDYNTVEKCEDSTECEYLNGIVNMSTCGIHYRKEDNRTSWIRKDGYRNFKVSWIFPHYLSLRVYFISLLTII